MLNTAIRYQADELHCDALPLAEIAAAVATPCYVYSLGRIIWQLRRLRAAFAPIPLEIHYSAKANANLDVLRTVSEYGAGIDAVSGGEIWRARQAGCAARSIVFAGVGKTAAEIDYAVGEGVGWINIENAAECALIQEAATRHGRIQRVGLRLNPNQAANTLASIATGHANAKFGLSAEAICAILKASADFPALDFAGIHIHIGSQLADASASKRAIAAARQLLATHPRLRNLNIGGGYPVPYRAGDDLPSLEEFATAIRASLRDLPAEIGLLLEPGRALVADAGLLLTRVLYTKQQFGQTTVIVDASMSELMRPALYGAQHEIVPLRRAKHATPTRLQIVGPICETTDTLASDIRMPLPKPGELLAILTAGAYGMVLANNYNARPRPAEVVILAEGNDWRISRAREDWRSLYPGESS